MKNTSVLQTLGNCAKSFIKVANDLADIAGTASGYASSISKATLIESLNELEISQDDIISAKEKYKLLSEFEI